VPSAETIGVGACPPSVGDPIKYPSALRISITKLSDAVNSQLIILTLTPVLLIPQAMASAIAAVFPYALANNRVTLKLLYFWRSPQLW